MRYWVFEALLHVVLEGTYSNLYLKDHLQELPVNERAAATRIFYGTIQNYRFCESVWKPYATRKVDRKIAVLLTMAVYELLFMENTPAYTIINETVALAAKVKPGAKGFVNAVLRKVQEGEIQWPADPLERLAMETSVPLWLIRLWNAQYGSKETEEMARATNQILPVYVRLNPAYDPAIMDQDPAFEKAGKLWKYNGREIFRHPFYRKGVISVQDPGSYEIAEYLQPRPGDKVLDVCAAPGTKTMAVMELMKNKGSVDALDLHKHRVKLIENDAQRLHLQGISARQQDSTDLEGFGLYDRVLCDVPCTGYGVLARKPDIKLRMEPTDMDSLIPVQKQILEQAGQHVKEGGTLVYSTCTANRKENEKQVEAFLKAHPDFQLEAQQTLLPGKGADGFYMARLVRSGRAGQTPGEPV